VTSNEGGDLPASWWSGGAQMCQWQGSLASRAAAFPQATRAHRRAVETSRTHCDMEEH